MNMLKKNRASITRSKKNLNMRKTSLKNQDVVPHSPVRIDFQPENVQKSLGKLILILIKLIHELLERQAIRRIDKGDLTEKQIERLGFTLMKQVEEINRLRDILALKEEDLNLDLGPLGKLL